MWEAQAVRSQKDYLQISYPGLTFPKKSLLAFFLVFLTAAHRVTLSDCLQRPADGLRKSRQHFILIFGEGEIVLFEEETLVEGRCSWADREDNPLARLADSHPPCLA